IWWFIVFCICLSACVLSIYEVYKKWEQSPVIVSLANRGTPVNAIPFPAVTICPESKIAGEDKFNYSNILWKRENQIPLTQQDIHYQDFHKSDNATNWSLEGGYTSDAGYPRRTFSAAVSKGLRFNIFLPDDDLDLACISPVRGYKILVHAPTDIPLLGEEYIRVPLSQSVVVAIQPYMITTSSSIKKYSPKKRGCYFQEERYLKYFQTYTAESCKLECLTNFTLEFCGCVHFFMPRENDTKICGSANITCMEKVDSTSAVYTDEDCDCLPRCSDLNYEVSITYYMTSLTFYFQSDDFITSQRNEFYGPTDFLANFGG
ncbi:ASC domain containing protein, partial [Asbolus verrucosus]